MLIAIYKTIKFIYIIFMNMIHFLFLLFPDIYQFFIISLNLSTYEFIILNILLNSLTMDCSEMCKIVEVAYFEIANMVDLLMYKTFEEEEQNSQYEKIAFESFAVERNYYSCLSYLDEGRYYYFDKLHHYSDFAEVEDATIEKD